MKRRSIRKIILIYFIFLSTAHLPGCGFIKPENLKMISANSLHTVMSENDILLFDVHIPEQKHIEGTDQFAPFYKVDTYLEHLPTDKNAPIYLYCKSGPMANWAARTLFDMGYTNIYNLEGGMDAWIELNLPVNDQ